MPWTWWGVCLPSRLRRTSVTSSTWWVAIDVLAYLSALWNKVTTTLLGKWRGGAAPVGSYLLHTSDLLVWSPLTLQSEWNLLLAEVVEPLLSGDHWLFCRALTFPFRLWDCVCISIYFECSISYDLTFTPACWASAVLTIASACLKCVCLFHPQTFMLCSLTTERQLAVKDVTVFKVHVTVIVALRFLNVAFKAETRPVNLWCAAAPRRITLQSPEDFLWVLITNCQAITVWIINQNQSKMLSYVKNAVNRNCHYSEIHLPPPCMKMH